MVLLFFVKYPVHNFFPENTNQYCDKQHKYSQKEIHLLKIQFGEDVIDCHLVKRALIALKQSVDLVN
jgi:hypothetical protein